MIPPRETLWRLLALARPYLLVILAITLLSAVFAAGRYGRAYMMKPLLDGVLVPAAEENRSAPQEPTGLWPWEAREKAPPELGAAKYPPIRAIDFHTKVMSKYYGADYRATNGED